MAVNEERIRRTFFGIGASAGGIEALIGLLRLLPRDLEATLAVVIHRSATHLSVLAEIFGRHSTLPVREPEDGDPIRPGMIYLAPRDRHMLMEGDAWRLSGEAPVNRWRPAVDPLLISAAKHRGPDVVGVLLSGGGDDGVEGLTEIKKRGGLSVAQDPEQALQGSMPISAIRYDDVDLVLRVEEIAAIVPMLAAGQVVTVDGRARRPRGGTH
jgi:two-component system chemotaxis response regulator CheB